MFVLVFFFSVFSRVTMMRVRKGGLGSGWGGVGGALRRVFVLLCAAAAKIHPTQVISVCYPMVGAQSDASVVRRGVPAHGTWEEKRKSEEKRGREGGQKQCSSARRRFFSSWKEDVPPAEDNPSLACLPHGFTRE